MTEKINFIEGNKNYATDMPLWKLLLLDLITLTLYYCIWVYFNLRLLKFLKKSDISPWLAILAGIPLVPYYLFYKIFRLNNQNKFICHLKSLLLVCVMYFFGWLGSIGDPWFWFGFLGVIPMLICQHEINNFIKKHRV